MSLEKNFNNVELNNLWLIAKACAKTYENLEGEFQEIRERARVKLLDAVTKLTENPSYNELASQEEKTMVSSWMSK